MAPDLKIVVIDPAAPLDLQADILCLDIDKFGSDSLGNLCHAAKWLKKVRPKVEKHNAVVPCLVLLGTPPPSEETWVRRQHWETQLAQLIATGVSFWDRQTFAEQAEAWHMSKSSKSVYHMQAPKLAPGESVEPSEPVDLSFYLNAPLQMADADFQHMLHLARGPITERED